MRKTPMRMCIGCRQMKPKKELVRIVRTDEGNVEVDPTGRKNGRGAYVCMDDACLAAIKKQRQIDRALGVKTDEGVYEALSEHLERNRRNAEKE